MTGTATADVDTTNELAAAGPRGRRVPPSLLVVGGCAAAAALSLALVPAALAYDPTAWVVWGREVVRLDLDTVGGPSWKPLPVGVTAVVAPLGDAAPEMWMWVARTAGLLAFVGVVRLGVLLAGPVAGAIAGALLVITPDGEPRFVRTWAEGHASPATAALTVWAVERHVAGRRGTAFALVVGLALLRPEAWPFALAYGAWLWWAGARSRAGIVAGLVAIPVLWFGGDVWGAGDPFQGASSAQVIPLDLVERTTTALGNVGSIVILPAWIAAIAAVVFAVRRRDPVPSALGALAVAWCVVVASMAIVFGYAALSRFLLPAAAIVCALAGAGVVHAVASVSSAGARAALVTTVVMLSAPFVAVRVAGLTDVWTETQLHDDLGRDLDATIDALGIDVESTTCETIAVEGLSQLQPATAWALDVPLRDVRIVPETGDVMFFVVAGGEDEAELVTDPAIEALGGVGTIAAYGRNCR